jgi:rare lipoprotein A
VLGKTYHLLPTSEGYEEQGIASWYGTKFHGRPTANGEIYSLYEMTAAHRTLPIPSYVEVVNLDNGRKAVVRVNDRGPFHADRIIDLSYAAAVKLGYERAGTARVALRTIDASEPLANAPVDERAHQYFLQAGSFRNLASAQNLCSELIRITGEDVKIEASETPGFFRVRIGPLTDKKRVESLTALLVAEGMSAPRLLTR